MTKNSAQSKSHSPSYARNRDPILEVLREIFAQTTSVLEIGSGSGEHAVYFAEHLAHLLWQPSNRPGELDSVAAWVEEAGLANLCAPVELDLFEEVGPLAKPDAIVAINVIHIAPWAATDRLFELAENLLDIGGLVYLYGPFRYADRPLEPSNERFDAWLRERDPASGIRDFEAVDTVAEAHGFLQVEDRAMPANNRSVWWRRVE